MATATLTAAAPYIIRQDYAAYTPEQHSIWSELVGRVLPELEKHAAREYLEGFQIIGLQCDQYRLLRAMAFGIRRRQSSSRHGSPVLGWR